MIAVETAVCPTGVAVPARTGCLLRAAPALVVRKCDEGVLVFDQETGRTSLLNHHGALVLQTASCPEGVPEMHLRLASGMDQDSDTQEFQEMISSLESSGLLVRC